MLPARRNASARAPSSTLLRTARPAADDLPGHALHALALFEGAPLAFGAVLLASLLEEVELDGGGHCDSSSECTEGDLGGRGARGRGWP
jgi:hypothetical protein